MKRNTMVMMLTLLLVSVGTSSADQDDLQPSPLAETDLVADLWPSQEWRHPIRIAIRNLGFDDIPSEQSLTILMRCVLHISKPDGTERTRRHNVWRGRAPDDIQRGDLASHCVNTPIADLFKMDQKGRYLVWWTDGRKKSNVLVFQKDEQGIRRLP